MSCEFRVASVEFCTIEGIASGYRPRNGNLLLAFTIILLYDSQSPQKDELIDPGLRFLPLLVHPVACFQ